MKKKINHKKAYKKEYKITRKWTQNKAYKKITLQEDRKPSGRRLHRNLTSLEGDITKRRPYKKTGSHWKMTLVRVVSLSCTELGPAQPQLFTVFDSLGWFCVFNICCQTSIQFTIDVVILWHCLHIPMVIQSKFVTQYQF